MMVVSLGALSVASAGEPASAQAPLLGVWGGDRVNIVFGADGARLAYECAAGSIDGPVRLDSHGRFTAPGTHQAYRAGPDRADQTPATQVATYQGHLVGTMLELQVRIDGDAAVQSHRLEKNHKVKLARCL